MFEDSILAPRPPYVTFERRAIEKRKLIEEGGEPYFVEVDFALVTPQGSRDVLEKIVDEWFPQLANECRQGRFSPAWLNAYKEAYAAWKTDQAPPVTGFSVRLWPAATPAEIKQLVSLRVMTVEDLAVANEETLTRLGMGSRSLKQRAIDWLKAKEGTGNLVAQLESMRQTLAAMEQREKAQAEKIAQLEGALSVRQSAVGMAAPRESLEDRLAQAQASADSRADHAVDSEIEDLLR